MAARPERGAGRAADEPGQKVYFKAICSWRMLLVVEVIFPKLAAGVAVRLFQVTLGPAHAG